MLFAKITKVLQYSYVQIYIIVNAGSIKFSILKFLLFSWEMSLSRKYQTSLWCQNCQNIQLEPIYIVLSDVRSTLFIHLTFVPGI